MVLRRRISDWRGRFLSFQAEDGIRYVAVTGVQTCALPISLARRLLLLMGLSGVEPLTSRLSGVRSNHLSYRRQRTYLSYSVQSVPQSVPQLSVSDQIGRASCRERV